MIFLTEDDLKSQMFEVFMRASSNDFADTLNLIESQNIALVKSYLAGRYDVDFVFSAQGNDRNPLIIKVLVSIVLYDLIRRNAARKVPSDYVDRKKWAMAWLKDVQAGSLIPTDVPTSATGHSLFHGSSRNENWHGF